jgi:hypothetical protein
MHPLMLQALKDSVERGKAELDRLRPWSTAPLAQLQKHYDVELTYTSNAIEGNTLTLRETAEVIEHGITVGGKSLRDHLEAVDHYQVLRWMRQTAVTTTPLDEDVVRELHRRIVERSQSEIAGQYRELPRRIAGSPVIFPNPAKIPQLMQEFGEWLIAAPLEPETAFAAHFGDPPVWRRQRPIGAAADEPLVDPRRISTDRGAPGGSQGLSGRARARVVGGGFGAVSVVDARTAGGDPGGLLERRARGDSARVTWPGSSSSSPVW